MKDWVHDPMARGPGGKCVGCHALSRGSGRVALGLDVPNPAILRTVDVATRMTLFESAPSAPGTLGGSTFSAVSPDDQQVLATENGSLVLHDARTGAVLGPSPLVANATMPEWSPDQTQLVYVQSPEVTCSQSVCPGANPGIEAGSLYIAPTAGAGLGTPRLLVAGGALVNNFYPTFSPDGNWIAFNQSPASTSFVAPDAKLAVVAQAGGMVCDLGVANTMAGNSWPKFAPFVHHFGGKTIFWLSFSSKRNYGLRLDNTPGAPTRWRRSGWWR
jgi:TolB protein